MIRPALVVTALTIVPFAPASHARMPDAGQAPPAPVAELLSLYAQYRGGNFQVLERTVTTEKVFERLRSGIDPQLLDLWKPDRHPSQAVFLLELALVGFNHKWEYWLDVLVSGRRFLFSRTAPPGADPAADAFELRWHKAAIGLLEGNRRPDLLLKHGVNALEHRIAARPPAPGERPVIVDPWFALTRGITEEQFLLVEPNVTIRVANAIEQFDVAAAFESTRAEALVRKARLQLLGREPAAALRTLDTMPATPDLTLRYWRQLFRGRALEAVDRADDAARAYADALALVPHAQSPAVALTVLELRRGNDDEAYRWATVARRPETLTADPWWDYWSADFRLFKARLIELRLESR